MSSFGFREYPWDTHLGLNCLMGGIGGALSTIAPEPLTGSATTVPVIGGLLVGATFLTVFQLSDRFLLERGMDSRNMQSRLARAAVFASKFVLALLAAGCAAFVVGTLAGYTLTAWQIFEVGCASMLTKLLIGDSIIRRFWPAQEYLPLNA